MSNRTGACLICDSVAKRVFDFLSHYQYELATNPAERVLHAQRGGFCAPHAWQYLQLTSPNGLCMGHAEFMESIGVQLLNAANVAKDISELVRELDELPAARPACIVCECAAKAEEEALGGALREVNTLTTTTDFIPLFCFPHLATLAARCADLNKIRLLVGQHGEEFKRVAEEMRQYVAKFNDLRRDLITNRERAAPMSGLMLLVGRSGHHL